MIVRCPSCGTRYRHDEGAAGLKARCSRCFEMFPFPAVLRSYRLAAVASSPGAPPGREAKLGNAVAAAVGLLSGRGPGTGEPAPSRAAAARSPLAPAEPRSRPDLAVGGQVEEPVPSARPAVLVAAAVALAWVLGGESFAAWVLLAAGGAAVAAWGFRWSSRRT